MKTLLTFILALLSLTVHGASPSFGAFNSAQFGNNGSSAIWRTNQTFYNVQDFGAKLDGVTDDTAAWNKALIAGDSFQPPNTTSAVSGQLYIPSGRYVLGMPGAQIVRISGTGAATGSVLNNANFFVNAGQSNGTVNSNIVLDGFLLNGNYSNQPAISYSGGNYMGQVAVRFVNVQNLTVKNCVVISNAGFNFQFAGITNGNILNNQFWRGDFVSFDDDIHFNGPDMNVLVDGVLSVSNNTCSVAFNANDDGNGLLSQGNFTNAQVRNVYRVGTPLVDNGGTFLQVLDAASSGGFGIDKVTASGFYGLCGYAGILTFTANEGQGTNVINSITVDGFNATSIYSNSPLVTVALPVNTIKIRNGIWTCGSAHSPYATGPSGEAMGANLFAATGGETVGGVWLEDLQVFNHSGTVAPSGLNSDAPISVAVGSIGEMHIHNVTVNRTTLTSNFPFIYDSYENPSSIKALEVDGVTLTNFSSFASFSATAPTIQSVTGVSMPQGNWTSGLKLGNLGGFGSLLVRSNTLTQSLTFGGLSPNSMLGTDAATNATNVTVGTGLTNNGTSLGMITNYGPVELISVPIPEHLATTTTGQTANVVNVRGQNNPFSVPTQISSCTYDLVTGVAGGSNALAIFQITGASGSRVTNKIADTGPLAAGTGNTGIQTVTCANTGILQPGGFIYLAWTANSSSIVMETITAGNATAYNIQNNGVPIMLGTAGTTTNAVFGPLATVVASTTLNTAIVTFGNN